MSTIVSNPQANQEEIMQKLTASISKAPQFGYPAVQNSVDSLQKFAAQLEREFVDGERSLAESQENAFRKQPAFIQQVLVNIASLFSGYLS
ncbi:CHLPN 76 kD protein-like protein [Chlamydia trachomatis]|nr:CHLPN 76 kD protein-like protein [Chlamydia trachomatis]